MWHAEVQWSKLPHVPHMSLDWGNCAARCGVPSFWHLRHLLDSCRSFHAVVRVLAISTSNLISEFADDLEHKCMIRLLLFTVQMHIQ